MAGAASPPGTRNSRPSSLLENGPDSSLCFQRIHDPAGILLTRAHPFHKDGLWASLGKRVYVSDELLTQGVTARSRSSPSLISSREESIRCHPLEVYLSCAIGQQGAEPKVGLFCTFKTVPSFPGKRKEAEKVRFEPTRQLNTAYTISSSKIRDLTRCDVTGNFACLWAF